MRSRAAAAALLWLGVLGAAVALGVRALTLPGNALVDLQVYRGAVRLAQGGGSLYDFVLRSDAVRPEGLPFTYPPFAALVFWPLGWLPDAVADAAWTVAFLACVPVVAVVAARWGRRGEPTGPRAGAAWTLRAGLAALLLLGSYPVAVGLLLGQVSFFVLAAAFVDAVAVPPRWRGVLVGLAAAVKLTPLVFVAYFLVRRDRRAAARASAVFVGAGAAAWLLLPGDSFAYWTRLLWQPDRVGDVAELRNKSLLGLLERWLPLPGVEAVWLVAALTLAAIVLVRAARAADEGDAAGAAVAVGCLSAAVAPITWIHHLGWAVLAAWLLLTRPGWGWKTLGIAAAALLSVASPFCDPPPGVALDQLGRLGQDLPTLLTLALAVAVPASAGGVRVSVRADRLARG